MTKSRAFSREYSIFLRDIINLWLDRPVEKRNRHRLPRISTDEQLDEVDMFNHQAKDPLEGVEYITGADGVKRPMSWYKAQAAQARKENPVRKTGFFDALENPTAEMWPF